MMHRNLSAAAVLFFLFIPLFAHADDHDSSASARIALAAPNISLMSDHGEVSLDREDLVILEPVFSYKAFTLELSLPVSGAEPFSNPKIDWKVWDIYSTFFYSHFGIELLSQGCDGMQEEDSLEGVTRLKSLAYSNSMLNFYFFLFDETFFPDSFVRGGGLQISEGFVWSPYMRLTPGYAAVHSDVSFVPPGKASLFSPQMADLSGIEIYSMCLSSGVLAGYTSQGLYLSAMLAAGWALNEQRLTFLTYDPIRSRSNSPSIDYRMSAGANVDSTFFGAVFLFQFQMAVLGTTSMQFSYTGISVYAGMKF